MVLVDLQAESKIIQLIDGEVLRLRLNNCSTDLDDILSMAEGKIRSLNLLREEILKIQKEVANECEAERDSI
jgi:phage host-nuclease inhibitor protein Gam